MSNILRYIWLHFYLFLWVKLMKGSEGHIARRKPAWPSITSLSRRYDILLFYLINAVT